MKNLSLGLILGVALSSLAWWLGTKNRYDLFIYPDREFLPISINGGRFASLEDARMAAWAWGNWLKEKNPEAVADYEIGKNLKYVQEEVRVYEKTTK